jgi:hypothetical protein
MEQVPAKSEDRPKNLIASFWNRQALLQLGRFSLFKKNMMYPTWTEY